ncbi:MAG: hypothetical protein ACR2P5_06300 [Gammaproteobacteria bacterium]
MMNKCELLKISTCHICKALGYMDMPHTVEESNKGIIYACQSHKPNNWVVWHDDKQYGHRDLLRIAYLFATRQKPKDVKYAKYGKFSDRQIKGADDKIMPRPQWSSINWKFWATLGFVQERIPVSGKGSRPIK